VVYFEQIANKGIGRLVRLGVSKPIGKRANRCRPADLI